MITICFTYFKSLSLANLAAALYSVRRQDFTRVKEMVIVDNDTQDSTTDISAVVLALDFPVPVRILSFKHGDPLKTHSWSTNVAVSEATTPWVLFTRADYLLHFDTLKLFGGTAELTPDWDGFVTGNGCHLAVDVSTCEQTQWRQQGPQMLQAAGAIYDYTCIDAGVWLARRESFNRVGGLDEALTAWGHAQTYFQWKLHQAGVECMRIPEVLFYHPQHGGAKDLDLAHRQLQERGIDLREMWARYEGPRVY